ncbi:hypothetical protein PUR71_01625 [Streptomyces sp. SP17BM10]|uniref:hypothetical protein n=1 Tax=Streptomyces sp. SP17BM10 TaxID=3002530 RepID=UPI002E7A6BED|nr:hypothetical protein [Streptomyces sp. SP17BM10]MEE1781640.1 hypothetical protein [Streptomyces sp. SP17BM10]
MSLREIAQRAQEPAADADQCPTCQLLDAQDAEHAGHPKILGRIARWRAQHVADGECLAVPDDDE